MPRLERGAGHVDVDSTVDDIVSGRLGGLVIPANAGELSAMLLRAGADRGARGVLCTVDRALVALPPIDPQHYAYVPPAFRSVPVAVVVSAEQAPIYRDVAAAAACSGAIRRAFLCRAEAENWLREQVRALAANRAWWPERR